MTGYLKKISRSTATLMVVLFGVNMMFTPTSYAQVAFLPAVGSMVNLTPKFDPMLVKGVKFYADNPFKFDFIVDTGDLSLSEEHIKEEGLKLGSYFLASLTTPEKEMWVNLSPFENNRIIPTSFGQTEMGKEILAQDYMLKQIMATALYPERSLGKEFWNKVYAEAARKFGSTKVPVNTFNKVWILPDRATVYENSQMNAVFVVQSTLKVMLEQDYLAANKNKATEQFGMTQLPQATAAAALSSKIIKEIVIPALEKEVNTGKNFAPLRQVYGSLILAAWYKKNLKDNVLSKAYVNKNKIIGVDVTDKDITQKIYQQYLQAYRKGVYSYIKEEIDPATQHIIPRKYFSGGLALAVDPQEESSDAAMLTFRAQMAQRATMGGGNRTRVIGLNVQPVGPKGNVLPMAAVRSNVQPNVSDKKPAAVEEKPAEKLKPADYIFQQMTEYKYRYGLSEEQARYNTRMDVLNNYGPEAYNSSINMLQDPTHAAGTELDFIVAGFNRFQNNTERLAGFLEALRDAYIAKTSVLHRETPEAALVGRLLDIPDAEKRIVLVAATMKEGAIGNSIATLNSTITENTQLLTALNDEETRFSAHLRVVQEHLGVLSDKDIADLELDADLIAYHRAIQEAKESLKTAVPAADKDRMVRELQVQIADETRDMQRVNDLLDSAKAEAESLKRVTTVTRQVLDRREQVQETVAAHEQKIAELNGHIGGLKARLQQAESLQTTESLRYEIDFNQALLDNPLETIRRQKAVATAEIATAKAYRDILTQTVDAIKAHRGAEQSAFERQQIEAAQAKVRDAQAKVDAVLGEERANLSRQNVLRGKIAKLSIPRTAQDYPRKNFKGNQQQIDAQIAALVSHDNQARDNQRELFATELGLLDLDHLSIIERWSDAQETLNQALVKVADLEQGIGVLTTAPTLPSVRTILDRILPAKTMPVVAPVNPVSPAPVNPIASTVVGAQNPQFEAVPQELLHASPEETNFFQTVMPQVSEILGITTQALRHIPDNHPDYNDVQAWRGYLEAVVAAESNLSSARNLARNPVSDEAKRLAAPTLRAAHKNYVDVRAGLSDQEIVTRLTAFRQTVEQLAQAQPQTPEPVEALPPMLVHDDNPGLPVLGQPEAEPVVRPDQEQATAQPTAQPEVKAQSRLRRYLARLTSNPFTKAFAALFVATGLIPSNTGNNREQEMVSAYQAAQLEAAQNRQRQAEADAAAAEAERQRLAAAAAEEQRLAAAEKARVDAIAAAEQAQRDAEAAQARLASAAAADLARERREMTVATLGRTGVAAVPGPRSAVTFRSPIAPRRVAVSPDVRRMIAEQWSQTAKTTVTVNLSGDAVTQYIEGRPAGEKITVTVENPNGLSGPEIGLMLGAKGASWVLANVRAIGKNPITFRVSPAEWAMMRRAAGDAKLPSTVTVAATIPQTKLATGQPVGGIDLEKVDVNAQGGGVKTAFNDPQVLDMMMKAEGLKPVIYNIQPVTLPMVNMFLGFNNASTVKSSNV